MNHIEKLISNLCPAGVIQVPLGEIIEVLNGYAFKSSKYTDGGVRVLRISNVQKGKIVDADPKFYPLTSIDEIGRYLLEAGDLLVSLTGNVGRVGQIPSSLLPAGLNQRVACLRVRDAGKLSLRYLYHLLDDTKFEKDCLSAANGSAQANLSTEWLKGYFVSLPPLEVQHEIVRILDAFTELEAELEAELGARKTQYEFYRKALLTQNDNTVPYSNLSELYEFQYGTGNTIPTSGGIFPVYGSNGIVGTHSEFNSEDAPVIGHIGAYAGIVNWASGKHFVTYNGVICKIKAGHLPRFGYHVLKNLNLRELANAGSQPFVSYDKLRSVQVQIPGIEVQANIAGLLDSFESLVGDEGQGLPGEIRARRQQYEYYRNKLLTFKALEVA